MLVLDAAPRRRTARRCTANRTRARPTRRSSPIASRASSGSARGWALAQTAERFGVDDANRSRSSPPIARAGAAPTVRVLRGIDPALDARAAGQRRSATRSSRRALSEMRLIKDELEVRELRRAIDATQRGFDDVVRALPQRADRARGRRRVQPARARRRQRRRLRHDRRQRPERVHAALDAQRPPHRRGRAAAARRRRRSRDALHRRHHAHAADRRHVHAGAARRSTSSCLRRKRRRSRAAKPGNDFLDPNRAAMDVLAHGLERLGILASADEALRDENQFYKRYSLHNVSHMLGLDVHDCAAGARRDVQVRHAARPAWCSPSSRGSTSSSTI